jgi:hypothetical protein
LPFPIMQLDTQVSSDHVDEVFKHIHLPNDGQRYQFIFADTPVERQSKPYPQCPYKNSRALQ